MVVPDGLLHRQFGYYDDEVAAVRGVALLQATATRVITKAPLAELKGKAARKKQPQEPAKNVQFAFEARNILGRYRGGFLVGHPASGERRHPRPLHWPVSLRRYRVVGEIR